MSTQITTLINTRLQPGVADSASNQPFQRLAGVWETVKTVLEFLTDGTGLKPGVNENGLPKFTG